MNINHIFQQPSQTKDGVDLIKNEEQLKNFKQTQDSNDLKVKSNHIMVVKNNLKSHDKLRSAPSISQIDDEFLEGGTSNEPKIRR